MEEEKISCKSVVENKIQEPEEMEINCVKEECTITLSIDVETEKQKVENEKETTGYNSEECLDANKTTDSENANSLINNFVPCTIKEEMSVVDETVNTIENENNNMETKTIHLKSDVENVDTEFCDENRASQKSQDSSDNIPVIKEETEINSVANEKNNHADTVEKSEYTGTEKQLPVGTDSSAVSPNVINQGDNKLDHCLEQHSNGISKKPKRKVLKKKKSASQNESSTVISNGNVCSSDKMNNSLNQLMSYVSESDSSDTNVNQVNSYRQKIGFSEDSENSDSDSSSTSSSTSLFFSNLSDCVESDEDDDNNHGVKKKATQNNNNKLKTPGELDLDDLPPVEDLRITVLEDECLPIGKIFQIVDKLVVVQSLKQTPVIDLDSVLFVEGGQALGRVFDVFGPVTEPYYCVRFNSVEQISDKNIVKDQMVYVAPKTKHTNYVFVSHLLKMKGSDASWTDNNEPPPHCLDYSDDEEERAARKKVTKEVKKEVIDIDEPVRKRPNAYEQRMNERNLRMNMISANSPRGGYRRRLYNNNSGKAFKHSELIWPPSISPSPYPPSPQNFSLDPFINNSPILPAPGNYQFRNPSFPPQAPVNTQHCRMPRHFGNPLFSPMSNQFGSSPLPSPSPVNHQFGALPFQPMNQMGNSFQTPPPMQQFSSSSIQPLNFHFGNLPLPQASTSYFGPTISQPPINQPIGNAFPQLPSFRAQFTSINSPLQHPLRPPSYIRSPPPLQWHNFKR